MTPMKWRMWREIVREAAEAAKRDGTDFYEELMNRYREAFIKAMDDDSRRREP